MDYFQEIFNEVTLLTPSTGAVIAGLLACALLFVSGFASGSEIAFFSLSVDIICYFFVMQFIGYSSCCLV